MKVVLLPIEMVPALAPAPVPPVALKVPEPIASVAVDPVWMLRTVSEVDVLTVYGETPGASRIASSPDPGTVCGVQSIAVPKSALT